jgi:hypothetical protein
MTTLKLPVPEFPFEGGAAVDVEAVVMFQYTVPDVKYPVWLGL